MLKTEISSLNRTIDKKKERDAFLLLLDREPTIFFSDSASAPSVATFLKMIVGSPEYALRTRARIRDASHESTEAMVYSLAWEQLAPWTFADLNKQLLYDHIDKKSKELASVFAYSVNKSSVYLHGFERDGYKLNVPDVFKARAELIFSFIQDAVNQNKSDIDTMLAFDVNDMAPECTRFPIFSFQRTLGELTPLMPDFEIKALDYFETAVPDSIEFLRKKTHAVFAGSTTGGLLTLEAIHQGQNQRVQSALHFQNSNYVTFRLPSLVQCDAEAEKFLLSKGFGWGRMEWPEVYQNKFIISMDGNGATCSRSHMALKSNSALLKYNSPFLLFYSLALIPGEHYIPVSQDDEVEAIIKLELDDEGKFETIARSGRIFSDRLLNRRSLCEYIFKLLVIYEGLHK